MASDIGVQIEFRAIDNITQKLHKIISQFNKFEDTIRKSIPTITKLNNQINDLSRKLNTNISSSFSKVNSTMSGSNTAFKKVNSSLNKINATNQKTYKITSQVSNATKQFTKKIKNNSKSLDNLHPRLSRYVSGIGGIAVKLNSLTMATTLAITGIKKFSKFLIEGVKSAGNVEIALQKVSNITGKAGDDLLLMKQIAIEIGEATKFTTQDMLEAQKNLGQMGLIAKDTSEEIVRGLTETVAYYAVATDRTIQDASADIGAGVASIGISAEEVADKMFYMSNNSLMAYNEMRGVFSKYGQLVKVNNQNVDSLLALTGAYREVAKSTNLASTHVKSFGDALIAVHKSSNKLSEMKTIASAIGKTDLIYDAGGKMRNIVDIIGDLKTAYTELGYTQAQINTSLATMFNKTAVGVYQGAVAKGIENIRAEAEKIGTKSVGVVNKAAEEMGNTFNGLVERIKGKFDNIRTAIGESLMHSAKEGAEKLLDALNKIDVGKLSEFISNLIEPIFEVFGMLIELLNSTVIPLLNDIFHRIQPIIELISQVLQTVIPIVGEILSKLTPLITIVGEIFNTIWNSISPLIEVLLNELVPLIESIVSLIETLWELLQPIVDIAITMIIDFLNPIVEALLPALTDIINTLNEILGPLFEIISDILLELKPFLEFSAGILGGAIATHIKLIFTLLKPVLEIVKFIANTLKSVWEFVKSIVNTVKEGLIKAWENVKKPVMDFFGFLSNIAKQVFGFIDKAMTKIFGENRWNSIKESISEFFKWVGDTFKIVADWIYDKIKWLIDPIMKLLGLKKESAESLQEQTLTVTTVINPEVNNDSINNIADEISTNLDGQIEIAPQMDTKLIQEEYDSLFSEISVQMSLNVKWAEYEEESAVRINQIKLDGLTKLVELKRQEIDELGSNIERESELVELLIKKKEIMEELNPENFLQQFADVSFEQYKIISQDIEKLVQLEDKIVSKRQSIYDKQAKEVQKYQNKVLQAQEKMEQYREKWFDKWENDITKLQDKIDSLSEKIADKQSEIDEKLKVKGTVLRSEILSDEDFSEYSTLDNIKDQVFDGFMITEETLQESLKWIEKVYPNEVGKIYEQIEQTVTEERNKLMAQYLTDDELFASAMLEEPMDAIRQKYADKPEILESILREIQEKTDETQLNLMEEILSNIQIIDDSSIQSMNEELSYLQDEMEDLRKQNIKDDKQWQNLNETLSETEELLNKTASPEYVESLMEQDRNLQELIATYENLRSELSFIQSADLTNAEALENSTDRLRNYKLQLEQMLEEKLIDETLLSENENLMNRFKELLRIQVSADLDGKKSKLSEIDEEIGKINSNLEQVIDKTDEGKIQIDLSATLDESAIGNIEDFSTAISDVDTTDLQEGFYSAETMAGNIKDWIENVKAEKLRLDIEDGTNPIKNIFSAIVNTIKKTGADQLKEDIPDIKAETDDIADKLSGATFKQKIGEAFKPVIEFFETLTFKEVWDKFKGSLQTGKQITTYSKMGAAGLQLMLEDTELKQIGVQELMLGVLMNIFKAVTNIDKNLAEYFTSTTGDTYVDVFRAGGLIEGLAPISQIAPDSYDNRLLGINSNGHYIFANGKEFILNESTVNNLGLENIEYMNKYGELPFNMLTDRYIPDFVIPPTPNLLNSSVKLNLKELDEPTRTSDMILNRLLEKENKADNRIEVLIKREDEKRNKKQSITNRPIIFNYNGRKSSIKLSKEEIEVMERIADRIANKNIKDSFTEFWES